MLSTPVLRRHLCALVRALRDERGYTLIELLVALVAGIIVTAAMGAIVVVTVHFSSNYADRVDVNQEGRIAMQKITQALNSSCVSSGVAPIVSTGSTGSYVTDGTHIYFYSAINSGVNTGNTIQDGPTITPALIEVAISGNSLVMNTYANTGGSAPAAANTNPWTFASTPTTTSTLLPYVAQTVSSGTTVPVFQYYGYTSGGSINTTPYTTTPALTAANAATTAEVAISYQTLPSDGFTTSHVAADITDQVVLRLTPASANTGVTNVPCS
jgi:Tfp pilus assembly protein PilW